MGSVSHPANNKRLAGILFTASILLLLPLIAMQFTNEVKWSASDFIIMGILLLSTGLGIELVLRKFKRPVQRLTICAIVLGVFFLIWAELAVGIFGSPFAGS